MCILGGRRVGVDREKLNKSTKIYLFFTLISDGTGFSRHSSSLLFILLTNEE